MEEQELYNWCIRQIKKFKVKERIARDIGDFNIADYHRGHVSAFGVMARKIAPYYRGGKLPELLKIQ